ncbi:MAG: hypothetical protein KGL39_23810, partial [Patescibacteria group bacterium]|nr:hypothetical protein [Patescibacteria group bacterium]
MANPNMICSRPECQTTAGCKCGETVVFRMPEAFTELPTMQLRWHYGTLEQAFICNGETVWRAIP